MAAHTPASPPPATSRSQSSGTSRMCGSLAAKGALGAATRSNSGRGGVAFCASARSASTIREYPKKSRRFTPLLQHHCLLAKDFARQRRVFLFLEHAAEKRELDVLLVPDMRQDDVGEPPDAVAPLCGRGQRRFQRV